MATDQDGDATQEKSEETSTEQESVIDDEASLSQEDATRLAAERKKFLEEATSGKASSKSAEILKSSALSLYDGTRKLVGKNTGDSSAALDPSEIANLPVDYAAKHSAAPGDAGPGDSKLSPAEKDPPQDLPKTEDAGRGEGPVFAANIKRDRDQRVIEVEYAHGKKSQIEYDDLGKPKKIVDGLTGTTFIKDQNDRWTVKYPPGIEQPANPSVIHDVEIDPDGRIKISMQNGAITTLETDGSSVYRGADNSLVHRNAEGQVTEVTDAEGHLSTVEYNKETGKSQKITDGRSGISYTRDGNIWVQDNALPTELPQVFTSIEVEANGDVTYEHSGHKRINHTDSTSTIVAPDGTSIKTDSSGTVVGGGEPPSEEPAAGDREQKKPDVPKGHPGEGPAFAAKIKRDESQHVTEVEYANGRTTKIEYDDLGKPRNIVEGGTGTTFIKDQNDRWTVKYPPGIEQPANQPTIHDVEVDPDGRIKISMQNGAVTTFEADGTSVYRAADDSIIIRNSDDNVKQITDAKGYESNIEYNKETGKPENITDGRTGISYSWDGKVWVQVDAPPNEIPQVFTNIEIAPNGDITYEHSGVKRINHIDGKTTIVGPDGTSVTTDSPGKFAGGEPKDSPTAAEQRQREETARKREEELAKEAAEKAEQHRAKAKVAADVIKVFIEEDEEEYIYKSLQDLNDEERRILIEIYPEIKERLAGALDEGPELNRALYLLERNDADFKVKNVDTVAMEKAADAIFKALDGGNDTETVYEILKVKNEAERQMIDALYRIKYGWKLVDEFKDNLEGSELDKAINLLNRKDGRADDAGDIYATLREHGESGGRSEEMCEKDVRQKLAGMNSHQIEQLEKEFFERYKPLTLRVALNNPDLSEATRQAIPFYLMGSDKRKDEYTLVLANIALKHENLDMFCEAMSLASPEARRQFLNDAHLMASMKEKFSGSVASDYVIHGKLSTATKIWQCGGAIDDSETGIEGVLSRMTPEERNNFRRGRQLAQEGADYGTCFVDFEDQTAFWTYSNIHQALDFWGNDDELARWEDMALSRDGKGTLVTKLGEFDELNDDETAVFKTIEDMSKEEWQLLQNPVTKADYRRRIHERLRDFIDEPDLGRMMDLIDRKMAAKNHEEAKQVRRPLLEAMRDAKRFCADAFEEVPEEDIYHAIANMTLEEQRKYRNEPEFKKEVDQLVFRFLNPDERKVVASMLEQVAREEKPNPDIVTKLYIHATNGNVNEAQVIRDLQYAIRESEKSGEKPTLRERIDEERAFKEKFEKALHKALDSDEYEELAKPLLETGHVPIDKQMYLNESGWGDDELGAYKDILNATPEERDKILTDETYRKQVMGFLNPAEQAIVLNIIKQCALVPPEAIHANQKERDKILDQVRADKKYRDKLFGGLSDEEKLVALRVLQFGPILPEDMIRAHAVGDGTGEQEIKEAMSGLPPEEINRVMNLYASKYGVDLTFDLISELGGQDKIDALRKLRERPVDPGEDPRIAFNQALEEYYKTRGGIDPTFGGTGALADDAINEYVAEIARHSAKFPELPPQRQKELIENLQRTLNDYRASKGTVTDALIDGTLAVIAVAGSIVTEGASLSLLAAIGAGTAAGAFKVAAKAILMGSDYESSMVGLDAVSGFVDGFFSLVGANEAAAVLRIGNKGAMKAAQLTVEKLGQEAAETVLKGGRKALEDAMQTAVTDAIKAGKYEVSEATLEGMVKKLSRDGASEAEQLALKKNLKECLEEGMRLEVRSGVQQLMLEMGLEAGGGASGAATSGMVRGFAEWDPNKDLWENLEKVGKMAGVSAAIGGGAAAGFSVVFKAGGGMLKGIRDYIKAHPESGLTEDQLIAKAVKGGSGDESNVRVVHQPDGNVAAIVENAKPRLPERARVPKAGDVVLLNGNEAHYLGVDGEYVVVRPKDAKPPEGQGVEVDQKQLDAAGFERVGDSDYYTDGQHNYYQLRKRDDGQLELVHDVRVKAVMQREIHVPKPGPAEAIRDGVQVKVPEEKLPSRRGAREGYFMDLRQPDGSVKKVIFRPDMFGDIGDPATDFGKRLRNDKAGHELNRMLGLDNGFPATAERSAVVPAPREVMSAEFDPKFDKYKSTTAQGEVKFSDEGLRELERTYGLAENSLSYEPDGLLVWKTRGWAQEAVGESFDDGFKKLAKERYGSDSPEDILRLINKDPEIKNALETAMVERILLGDIDMRDGNFRLTRGADGKYHVVNIDLDHSFKTHKVPSVDMPGEVGLTRPLAEALSGDPLNPELREKIAQFVKKYDTLEGREELAKLGLNAEEIDAYLARAKHMADNGEFPEVAVRDTIPETPPPDTVRAGGPSGKPVDEVPPAMKDKFDRADLLPREQAELAERIRLNPLAKADVTTSFANRASEVMSSWQDASKLGAEAKASKQAVDSSKKKYVEEVQDKLFGAVRNPDGSNDPDLWRILNDPQKLRELSKTDPKMREFLARNPDQAKVVNEWLQASEKFARNEAAVAKVVAERQEQLQKLVDELADANGLPRVKVEVGNSGLSEGYYSNGRIHVQRDLVLANNDRAFLTEVLYHEFVHNQQESLVIRNLVDNVERAGGRTLNQQEITELQDILKLEREGKILLPEQSSKLLEFLREYHQVRLLYEVNSKMEISDDRLLEVLRARNGNRLMPEQVKHAEDLMTAMGNRFTPGSDYNRANSELSDVDKRIDRLEEAAEGMRLIEQLSHDDGTLARKLFWSGKLSPEVQHLVDMHKRMMAGENLTFPDEYAREVLQSELRHTSENLRSYRDALFKEYLGLHEMEAFIIGRQAAAVVEAKLPSRPHVTQPISAGHGDSRSGGLPIVREEGPPGGVPKQEVHPPPENPSRFKPGETTSPDLRQELRDGIDMDEAPEVVASMRAKEDPVITVPMQYLDAVLADGAVSAKSTWIGHKLLVGTLGMPPANFGDTGRFTVRVINPDIVPQPRATGPDSQFHGVVAFREQKLVLGKDIEIILPDGTVIRDAKQLENQ